MNNAISKFNEFKQELLSEYCRLKYVSKEDEQDYLRMFEEVSTRTKRFLGRGSVGTIMFPTDVANYKTLPKKLKIYRGYHEAVKRKGISWSLSKRVADGFAHHCRVEGKNDVEPSVVTGTCSKRDVLAYTNEVSEQEIIINPNKVRNIVDVGAGQKASQRVEAEPLDDLLRLMKHVL